MKTIFEKLKLYFENNSEQQIIQDWSETEKYNSVGPKIDEFFHQSKIFYETEIRNSYWEFSCKNEILENPKFASDFFYLSLNLK
ncbi:hypothetical protein [Epilithonimonas hominis]|uniref:hypothetical protein n=1 Tax=Epilithonimonas hominis TaxID=420404 RepID=UPI000ED5D25D|nr:hypothetical protein [Epilithonimonas hominis]HAP96267.1 hypothetical protein [Chryseobacterium sp.]